MIKWQKLVAEYASVCSNSGFHGTAFRLNEHDLSLAEALDIISEMATFLYGFEYAAERSVDKEKLLSSVKELCSKTHKMQALLGFRKEQNRKLLT